MQFTTSSPNITLPTHPFTISIGPDCTVIDFKKLLFGKDVVSGEITLVHGGRTLDDPTPLSSIHTGEGVVVVHVVARMRQDYWSAMLAEHYAVMDHVVNPAPANKPQFTFHLITIGNKPFLLKLPQEQPRTTSLPPTTETPTPPAAPEPPRNDQARRRAGDVRLILKLFFFTWLFSQGADHWRLMLMYAVAVVIFLWQSGRLDWLQGFQTSQPPVQPQEEQGQQSRWRLALSAFFSSLVPTVDTEAAAAFAAAEEAAAAMDNEQQGFI
jgi:hypothetical protein